MPTIIDLSPTIAPELPVWPGDPETRLIRIASLDAGDEFTLSELIMSVHAGTHVDAPAHYVRAGIGAHALPLNILVGEALVVDVEDVGHITAETLSAMNIPLSATRLLFRTQNSARGLMNAPKFHTDFVAITPSGAKWLVNRGVKLVGMDYYSIAPWENLVAPHQILLQAGVIIVEGLNLISVQPGPYQFVCLPLKLKDAEAAPARAILIVP